MTRQAGWPFAAERAGGASGAEQAGDASADRCIAGAKLSAQIDSTEPLAPNDAAHC